MHTVKYSDVRQTIKTGDLLFWTGNCFECRIVRVFTGSTYSHVGIAWVVGDRIFVLEATPPVVRIYPLSNKVPFFLVKAPEELSAKALTFALEHVGKPYSRWEAIKAYLGLLLDKNKTWECVEYTQETWRVDGYSMNVRAVPELLYQWCMKYFNPNTLYVEKD